MDLRCFIYLCVKIFSRMNCLQMKSEKDMNIQEKKGKKKYKSTNIDIDNFKHDKISQEEIIVICNSYQ